MDVRELIVELLDCDLDATVDLGVAGEFDRNDFGNFAIERSNSYVTLAIETSNYVLVNRSDFEEMKNRISKLDEIVDGLTNEL